MKPFRCLLLLLAACLAGCSTVSSRIQEKSALFASLDPATQERLQRGAVKVGDSQDMVYIAFGNPDFVREKTMEGSQETIWVYTTYRTDFAGTHFVGYHRRIYVDPRTRQRYVAHEPVYATAYRDRTEEYMRVVFREGRVTAIEKLQD